MRSKKALYNLISNLILQIVAIVYGFIVPRIIIEQFGSNVNGLISSVTQFLGYIVLLESGFGPVVKAMLYKPIANRDNKTIASILYKAEHFFRRIALFFVFYIIVLCFIYPLIVNNSFDTFFTISIIIIISISTFAEYFFGMTYKLYLQSDQKSYIISIIQIGTYILSGIAVIFMAKWDCSIQLIKLISGLIFVIRPILQNIYVKKKYKIDFTNINKAYEIKQKWDGLIQHIAAVIHSNTDITLLTIFCPLTEVSIYAVYHLIVNGIKNIVQIFSDSVIAGFGDMIARNEQENLLKKFCIYEVLYLTFITIVFTCTLVLIVPFVSVYTKGILDTNYLRELFATLMVISELMWAVRLPYSKLTLAAGHFKETQKGAWLEAFLNIFISIFLVKRYGLEGVTIGTIVATAIRTIEFNYHSSKYILKRNVVSGFIKPIISIIETLVLFFILVNIHFIEVTNYLSWVIYAGIIFVISSTCIGLINLILYRKEFVEIKNIGLKLLKKK